KNKNVVAKFVTKSPDPYIASDLDEDSLKILEMLERMSLVSILESLSYMKASSSELAMLENLARISGLPQEVINVMILYVNNEKQGVFPGYSYFEKIASTWKRAGIKTAREALEYINKPKSKSSFKKVKETPEWLNKYEEEHKNIKSKELTEEETQKVLEEAQKMFKVKEK
ncbi:MAG: DnaD domain protein, partial [Bacilli bacterium]|nr:DnaD domain protein [Bacilli bacterium]